MTTPLYVANATVVGGREGHAHSDSPKLDLDLRMPKELGGAGGEGTNPEQLFAAGYAACFESALMLVARTKKIAVKEVTIDAQVSLHKTEAGGFGLAVQLRGKLPGVPREQAEELMKAAHGVCPYSNATRGNIEVKLSVD
jgi:osmotically inducible protein OsmC